MPNTVERVKLVLLECRKFNQLSKKYFKTCFHYMIFEHISHDSILSYIKEADICYKYLGKKYFRTKFHYTILKHISQDTTLYYTVVLYYQICFYILYVSCIYMYFDTVSW